ncbi:right-handed parallel beta-helix repeat-containing protein [Algibacter mikhailovii]|uniref:right-handed parallel beta-helix repeat-containing protein n=1 Tax=Algibacter mikhailovii TaxID=425498 RepID=UPI0024956EF3|nr:right-handed parallel beta-helix repeat-containing protein [Algibacter mikhailovii]
MKELKQSNSPIRISIFVFCLLGMVVFSCFSKGIDGETVVFNVSIAEDATQAVLSRILEAKEKPISQIKFEKGTYHFYPDKGLEQFVYISNHCDLMVNTPFPLNGFNNLDIDGQGSTFIFHGVIIPFLIDESSNVSVKNLTIDWADPFHSEGLIVARDENKKTFDMQISDTYPYEIRNGQIFFIKPYYEHSLGQSILFDPERKAIAYNTEAYTGISTIKKNDNQRYIESIEYKYEHEDRAPEYKYMGKEANLFVEELKPGVVRVHNHKKKMPPVGMILVMKGEQGFNRVSPAFRVSHTKGFNATNINIHHAGGMGIIAENSSDLILDRFNITPSHGRMVSTTADATHFVGCSGKVVIKNSTFNNQLDDATNVHGTYQKIVDILSENQIGVRMMHHQQKGFVVGQPNETLGFVRLEKSFFPYKKTTIASIDYINDRYQIVTLKEKLPKEVKVGDLIENLDGYPELLVKNCKISNNRARGLLISNPKRTVIEDNFFNTEMEAILIPVESGYWFESGNAANVIIRNNVFQDCQHGGHNRGIIRLVTDEDNRNIAFKNIEISNNTFNQFDNLILEVSNTDGLKFTGNTITNSGTFPRLHPSNPVIQTRFSKNIELNNNTYSGLVDNTSIINSDIDNLKFK